MSSKQDSEKDRYFDELLSQGNNNLNICPTCFRRGVRTPNCKNGVILLPEKVLVCCWLGDKHEISKEAFEAKVAALKGQ
jgi:hypothetical protein